MSVKKWPDGDSLTTDPRGDDPTFYYLPSHDWSKAVGFMVSPLFEHAKALHVEISIPPAFLGRLVACSDQERHKTYRRVLETLVSRFTIWRKLTLAIEDPVLGDAAFEDEMGKLGWTKVSGLPHTFARS
jgi:hypothetical protein